MEYAEGGDLYSLIKQYKKQKKTFTEEELWRFAYEILSGIDYLHTNNIIHRDIKCLNLFLTKDKKIKIGDLGVSKIVSSINALHCTRVGTPLYLSPELIKQVPYDFKVDIWSVGCSLYHLACLEPPFSGDNLIVLGNNIVKTKQKVIPGEYSKQLSDLIEKLLSKKSDNRPSAKEAFTYIPDSVIREYNLLLKKNPMPNNKELISLMGFNQPQSQPLQGENINGISSTGNLNNQNFKKESFKENNVTVTGVPPQTGAFNKLEKKLLGNRPLSSVGTRPVQISTREDISENPRSEIPKSENSKSGNIPNLIIPIQEKDDSHNISSNFNNFLKNKQPTSRQSKLPTPRSIYEINGNKILSKDSVNNVPINLNSQSGSMTNIFKRNNHSVNGLKSTEVGNFLDSPQKKSKGEFNNLIQNVENFMIHTDEDEDNFFREKPVQIKSIKDEKNISNAPLVSPRSFINSPKDKKEKPTIKIESLENAFKNDSNMKRLLSAKVRAPNKFRPNTASNNKILVNHHIFKSNENLSNLLSNENENQKNHVYPTIQNSKPNRPFTALNRKNDGLTSPNQNNVINININFYNVDMNPRYIKPTPEKHLYYINDNLVKKSLETKNQPDVKKDNPEKIIENKKAAVTFAQPIIKEKYENNLTNVNFHPNRPQTGRNSSPNKKNNININLPVNKNDTKNNEVVFNKILKAIEGLTSANSNKKQLTISDLK
jgi:serine/threonine protein kinase